MHRIIIFALLACCLPLSASGAEPVQHDVCRCCPAQPTQPRPGTWEPIHYPTPLRALLFGSARFRPDPNFRWQPGQWVPIQPPAQMPAPTDRPFIETLRLTPIPTGSVDASQATVQVRAKVSPTTTIMGSGSYVTHAGKRGVLIAAHMAKNAATAAVTWHDGLVQRGPVTICDLSGVAWVQVAHPESDPLPLASNEPRRNDQLWFYGYGGKEQVLQEWLGSATEKVQATTETRRVNRLAKYDAYTSPGHAGGPILNRQGEVVGIISHGGGRAVKMDDSYVYSESMGPELTAIRRFITHEVPRVYIDGTDVPPPGQYGSPQ